MKEQIKMGFAFDRTLKHFEITARQLALAADVAPSQISEFRNGKRNLGSEAIDRLLCHLEEFAPGSRSYFCWQLAGGKPSLEDEIAYLQPKELATLLNAIADKLQSANQSKPVGILAS
ncbi:MAG: helix-turn-helix transcriptional regulator [Leptolyngbya sp. SIO4C5]|nr:helix-turn-helix transcriptional regulator [Leptolyngbya sp. SIO4C5]